MSVSYWILVKPSLLMSFDRIIQHVRQDSFFYILIMSLILCAVKTFDCMPSKRCEKFAISNPNLMYLQKE